MLTESGFVLLDKPSGMFSRRAAGIVARMFNARTFGHIGTLDEMASGVLPIAIGVATKMIPFVEETRPSAYDLARRGRAVNLPPRHVHIDTLELLGIDGDVWTFRTRCGRGTYVRAIARDIAQMCGTVATVTMIRRTQSIGFSIKNAVQLDFLENLFNNGGDFRKYLEPIDFGLGDIPVQNLDGKSAGLYKNGGFIATSGANGLRRVYCGDKFIGIGYIVDGILRPKRTI